MSRVASAGPSPRPGLRDVEPYASPQPDVTARLNTNECPHPLPPAFFTELASVVADLPLHRYPDAMARRLREELAAHAGHDPEGTWAANGSNEVLTQLLQAYGGPGRRAVVFEPTYLVYARLARLTHTALDRVALAPPFAVTDAAVAEAVAARPDVVVVCSPNNPTGAARPVGTVAAIAEALPDALVVVDEAYGEFAPHTTALPLVATHPNVGVVRTFSKAFALAGIRLGTLFAAPVVVDDLQRVRLPYHLSALTQAAGIVALHHAAETRGILDAIREQRDRIAAALGQMPGMTVFPSDANFVLFVPPADAVAVWHGLLARGVLVRDMTAVVPNALRVTAGAAHEVDLFLEALGEVLDEA